MLDSFRNFTKSLAGKIVVFIILGIIGVAFALGDVTGLRGQGAGKSATLVTVGGYAITETEVTQRLQELLNDLNARGGQPVTMAELLQRGGFEYVLNQLIAVHSVQEFAKDTGIVVDRATIDAAIANDQSFHGIDGKFDQVRFDAVLASRGKTVQQWREDVAISAYIDRVIPNAEKRIPVADGLVAPYASLILERRIGIGTLIRPQDMDAGPAPDDKTLTTFYTRNRLRYQVPERRIVRYAVVKPDAFKADSTATEAEIAQAYKAAGQRFAATEKRTVHQLVVPDQATANAVAADVKGGKSIADVAKARGLAPLDFDGVEKAKLATDSSTEVANAAFASPEGGMVGPIKTPIGWAVLKVEKIEKIAAKTLEQAHDELADEISQRKTAIAINALRQRLEDGAGNGATFDETLASAKLTAQRSVALAADGTDPDHPLKGKDEKPDQLTTMLAAAAFQSDPESQEPLIFQSDKDGSFAVVILDKVVPAAPRPLDTIKPQVLADYALEQQMLKARKAAQDLRVELNKGTPMREALAKLNIRALPPKDFNLVRGDLKPNDPPQTQVVFSTGAKKAGLVAAPEGAGYYVVYIDKIEETDGKGNPAAMAKAREQYLPATRQELIEQFGQSIQKHVKVTRNEGAITALKGRLSSPAAANQ